MINILEFFFKKQLRVWQKCKALGHDNVPIELFFKECWHILEEIFFNLTTQALNMEEFHPC